MRSRRISGKAIPGQVKFMHILPIEEHGRHDVSHGADCWCEPEGSIVVKHKDAYEFVFIVHRQERIQIVEQL